MHSFEIENALRDHLAGTPRKITESDARALVTPGVSAKQFHAVWQGLVDEQYLVPVPGTASYRWESLRGVHATPGASGEDDEPTP